MLCDVRNFIFVLAFADLHPVLCDVRNSFFIFVLAFADLDLVFSDVRNVIFILAFADLDQCFVT